jgi:hypothetical protein
MHVEMHLSLCMIKIRWKEMVEYPQKRPGHEIPLRKYLDECLSLHRIPFILATATRFNSDTTADTCFVNLPNPAGTIGL